jgi:very-short-patch-repair endonuclease
MNNLTVFESVEFGSVRTFLIDNEIWFVAKDVYNCLDVKNVSDAIDRLDEDEKAYSNLNDGNQNRIFSIINESGLYKLINTSNKKTANFKYRMIKWFQSLGFLKEISFKTRGEAEFSEALQKALEYSGFTVINQYAIGGFKIDMFIPEINVAIEYDEKAHKYRRENDTKREQDIKALIGCSFIRIYEQDGLFYNLGKVIVEIERGGK